MLLFYRKFQSSFAYIPSSFVLNWLNSANHQLVTWDELTVVTSWPFDNLTVWRVGCVMSWPNEFDAVKTYTTEYWRSPVSRVHVLRIWLGLIMTAIVVVYVWSWLNSHCATPSMGEHLLREVRPTDLCDGAKHAAYFKAPWNKGAVNE